MISNNENTDAGHIVPTKVVIADPGNAVLHVIGGSSVLIESNDGGYWM